MQEIKREVTLSSGLAVVLREPSIEAEPILEEVRRLHQKKEKTEKDLTAIQRASLRLIAQCAVSPRMTARDLGIEGDSLTAEDIEGRVAVRKAMEAAGVVILGDLATRDIFILTNLVTEIIRDRNLAAEDVLGPLSATQSPSPDGDSQPPSSGNGQASGSAH